MLQEREFELINIIGAELASNQRDLSRHMDLSLGSMNMLLRRLVAKGYIRVEQLNKRKVRYLLTPKGFSEKMRKSVNYTIKTLQSIGFIKERLRTILEDLYHDGARQFLIAGRSDLAILIEVVLKETKWRGIRVRYVTEIPLAAAEEVLLICQEQDPGVSRFKGKVVSVIHELSREYLAIS